MRRQQQGYVAPTNQYPAGYNNVPGDYGLQDAKYQEQMANQYAEQARANEAQAVEAARKAQEEAERYAQAAREEEARAEQREREAHLVAHQP